MLIYFLQMAVASQILLITTIKDIIRCEFKLTEDESAFISTVGMNYCNSFIVSIKNWWQPNVLFAFNWRKRQ